MASLGDLLAEEGFIRGKSKKSSTVTSSSRASSLPLYSSSDYKSRRERSRSDALSTRSQSAFSTTRSGQVQSEDLRRSLFRKKSSLDEYRREQNLPEIRGFDVESYDESQEIKEESDERYRVSYSDSPEELDEEDIEYTDKFQKSESYNLRSNNLYEDYQDNEEIENTTVVSELKLDEIAVKAIISILTGYIRRFFMDENFRASFYRSCASCLGTSNEKESDPKEAGVVTNLKDAIRVIGRTVNGSPSPQELKRASLQLSIITGLNSTELKDGFTFGIPNLHLVACSHLYLSVIYKFQKKDKASAKHILQVFCNSPNLARNKLLPSLWDRLFLPHLSHLTDWYDNEARFIGKTVSRMKKMKLLEEVYNNILDVGTYQIGVYYRDWLMEGYEAPEFLCIVSPQSSFMESSIEVSRSMGTDEFSSPRSSSSRPVVSRKLYESVFRQSKKFGRDEQMKDGEREMEEEQYVGSKISNERLGQVEEITEAYLPDVGEQWQEDYRASSPGDIPSSDILGSDEWRAKGYNGSIKLDLPKVNESRIKSSPVSVGRIHSPYHVLHGKENELTLKKLAEVAFLPHMSEKKFTNAGSKLKNSDINTPVLSPCIQPFGSYEEIDRGSFFSRIPEDFVCPLTGQLFNDPVTLESGQTYERAAIKEWLDQGNKTCPVTKRKLGSLALPVTNFVLKRVIGGWKSEHCRNLLFLATQMSGNESIEKQDYKSKDESALFIIEQLLTGFNIEEQVENAKYLIAVGGLQFLIRRLELGDLDEKTRVAGLLLCCIKADGCCRSYLATNIGQNCILELLHCEEVGYRTNAVALLIELICLNTRTAINMFIGGLQTEAIMNTMHMLLAYLQSVPPEERVLAAVLLLHIDLMAEPRMYSVYREEAVDSITLAVELCLSDSEIIPNTQRALLMLGGRFSFSGEFLTETWLLKQAGFHDNYDGEVDETILVVEDEEEEEEARAKEEWFKQVTLILLSSGKDSFLDTLSMCLGCGNTELVRVCLITVAWLSRALASLSLAEFQLSVFSALIPGLQESLESSHQMEHRVLASISLLNFSKIPECRVLLKKIGDEMRKPIESLVKVTWTAEHLYASIFGEGQESAGNNGS